MIWATCLINILALAVSLPLSEAGQSVGLDADFEWVQEILYPNAGTFWTQGQYDGVTWDSGNVPEDATDENGQIYLVSNSDPFANYLLADSVDLRLGQVGVQVPFADPGLYQVILFGQYSALFTIVESQEYAADS